MRIIIGASLYWPREREAAGCFQQLASFSKSRHLFGLIKRNAMLMKPELMACKLTKSELTKPERSLN